MSIVNENKSKLFRDATQGYIKVGEHMVRELVDIFAVQRLKDVAQTGIRPIYSGATHDRFSHSLGVYNFGKEIYEYFRRNLLADLTGNDSVFKFVEGKLTEYQKYYEVACIIHDIGHPAFSHTFEYIYDNRYIQLEDSYGKIDQQEVERLFDIYIDLKDRSVKPTRLHNELKKALAQDSANSVLVNDFHASQHEMMGAYQILRASRPVKDAIKQYMFEICNEKTEGENAEEIDYVFIACIIIGAQYSLPPVSDIKDEIEKRLDRSLKNCIVKLLNGVIDADSMDYLNRNAHFAGYSTSNLDVVRLCGAFSAHYDKERQEFESCMEKSALSALEGFISARHFEPRWLYSHHKIIYYEAFLVKYLYKKCCRYLFARHNKIWEREVETFFCKKNKDTLQIGKIPQHKGFKWKQVTRDYIKTLIELGCDNEIISGLNNIHNIPVPVFLEHYFVDVVEYHKTRVENNDESIEEAQKSLNETAECARIWTSFYNDIREAYYGYIMSPVGTFAFSDCSSFHESSDSDINALFKQLYLFYKDMKWDNLSDAEKSVNDRFDMFQDTLEEYHNRRYRQSLWKTEQEYFLFLSSIKVITGLSTETIGDFLINLIIENGKCEEFDDTIAFQSKDKRRCKAAYFNHIHSSKIGREQVFDDIFGIFGRGMVICIYGFRYKDFGSLKIRFKTEDGAKLVPYSEISGEKKRNDSYLVYIYYKHEEVAYDNETFSECSARLRKQLEQRLIQYILSQYGGKTMQSESYHLRNGKTIRDSVHGDIFVPDRFLKVVDSKAFQRLRGIKQLATADYVFPEASHTRFAHSLGTFHIMTLMMERICRLLDYLHISYTEVDRDSILMAALLHDVGHGPYSHAFEELCGGKKTHEEWTYEIITKDPELQQIFRENFGDEFAASVVDCLKKSPRGSSERGTLRFVFSALINSQLDADRLDYLMRDSFNTGVKLGIVDLQRLITSLELTQHKEELAVCISEDALSSVEQLIVSRFNMYDIVYFSPYKAFSEQLLINIVKRINRDGNLDKNSILYKARNNTLTLDDYLSLDDSKFQSEIYQYQRICKDKISQTMIDCFFQRRGYQRLRILDESVESNARFINDVEDKLKIKVCECDGFVYRIEHYDAYEYASGDPILVVGRDGVVVDLSSKSKIIGVPRADSKLRKHNRLWETIRSCIYVNYDILGQEKDIEGKGIDVALVKRIVEEHSVRRHTEIEEKYSCSKMNIEKGKNPELLLNGKNLMCYKLIGDIKVKHQEDTYYDTDDFLLAKHECSFRCRKYSDKEYVFTAKCSIDPNNGENGGQFIRSEFEYCSDSDVLGKEAEEFLFDKFKKMFNSDKRKIGISDLNPKIKVFNNRTSYNVGRDESDFKCEVSLDAVEYYYRGESKPDWQIEIELKSQNPIYRVELKRFASEFREKLGIKTEKPEELSKYKKALSLFGLQ